MVVYGYIQESGNVFTTASTTSAIDATYRSPDMTMGDAGIRKSMDRVNINWEPEGIVSSSLFVRYNYDDINTPQPSLIELNHQLVVHILEQVYLVQQVMVKEIFLLQENQ